MLAIFMSRTLEALSVDCDEAVSSSSTFLASKRPTTPLTPLILLFCFMTTRYIADKCLTQAVKSLFVALHRRYCTEELPLRLSALGMVEMLVVQRKLVAFLCYWFSQRLGGFL